jgi:hypothetical protein
MRNRTERPFSPWANRTAWLLAGVAFVLIWFGGVVAWHSPVERGGVMNSGAERDILPGADLAKNS